MGIDLSVIWFVIIVFATLMYIVMDDFDLGIGILFAAVRGGDERDVMVNSVAPVWDGNETWLVLGGAGLFGAFPLAYAVIIDALSVPLTLMLIGLIFRGVAFEFRFKATPSHRPFWDKAFLGGIATGDIHPGHGRRRGHSTAFRCSRPPLQPVRTLDLAHAISPCSAVSASPWPTRCWAPRWLVMKSERRAAAAACAELTRQLLLALTGGDSRGQPLDAAGLPAAIAERWFTSAQSLLPRCRCRYLVVAISACGSGAPRARPAMLTPCPFVLTLGLDLPRLQRAGDQRLAEHYSASDISLWHGRGAAAPARALCWPGALLIIPGHSWCIPPGATTSFAAKSPAARAIADLIAPAGEDLPARRAVRSGMTREGCAQTGDLLQRLGPGVYAFGGLILIINRSLTRVILAPISPNSVAILKKSSAATSKSSSIFGCCPIASNS